MEEKITIKKLKEKISARKPGIIDGRKEYAVLIPLLEKDGELCILFEKRSDNIKQPGDICFPGGKLEAGESITECVLRETEEELGIKEIDIIGRFDTLLGINKIILYTEVGVIKKDVLEKVCLNLDEVSEIFTVPLDFFIREQPKRYEVKMLQDTSDFPYEEAGIRKDYKWLEGSQEILMYNYNDKKIWGLTARIVKWFADFAR